MIETPSGLRAVEDLSEGDLVTTLDHGAQPLIWVGGREVLARGSGRAYRIRAGALGPNTPAHDLLLSAQHRVLLHSPIAQRMTGSQEVLVAVTKLVDLPGIDLAEDLTSIGYHHILCAHHELVKANGSWCETLLPGPQAVEVLGAESLGQIEAIMPDWRDMEPARPIIEGKKSRNLVARHLKNQKLVQPEKLCA